MPKKKSKGLVAMIAEALASSKKGLKRGRREPIKKDTTDFKTYDRKTGKHGTVSYK